MPTIKFTEFIIIHANAETVFDYTQDYRRRLEWDSFLQKAELIDGAVCPGKGVKAYCKAKNGLGMITEYVSFQRPLVTAIRMTKGPFMFASFTGSWNFKAQSNDTTQVIFLYAYTLRFPFNLVARLITPHLQKNVKQRLIDLKNCMEK